MEGLTKIGTNLPITMFRYDKGICEHTATNAVVSLCTCILLIEIIPV